MNNKKEEMQKVLDAWLRVKEEQGLIIPVKEEVTGPFKKDGG